MFSTDNNVETIGQLVEVIKHYIGLQTEYVKLDVIEKIVRLITALTLTDIVCFNTDDCHLSIFRWCLCVRTLRWDRWGILHCCNVLFCGILAYVCFQKTMDRKACC